MRIKIIWCFTLFVVSTGLFSQRNIAPVGNLPSEVLESSGLLVIGERLVTHNDSDGQPALYELDSTSLQLVRTVTITNATNTDWEDLAQDDQYIYIGDFGNNAGDRTDLNILRISKTDYRNSDNVTAEQIWFAYEDQGTFQPSPNENDWDAEAFFVQGDSLVVLTKQWNSLGTVGYKFPKVPGSYTAIRKDAYQVNGLVTAADYSEESNNLYLIGYSQVLTPFFVQVEGVTENTLFAGSKTKTNLQVGFAQMEAITATTAGLFYVSCEAFQRNSPAIDSAARVFTFTLDGTQEPNDPGEEPQQPEVPEEDQDALVLSKDFGSQELSFRAQIDQPILGVGIYDLSGKRVYYRPLELMPRERLDISFLRPSLYFFTLILSDGFLSRPFLVE